LEAAGEGEAGAIGVDVASDPVVDGAAAGQRQLDADNIAGDEMARGWPPDRPSGSGSGRFARERMDASGRSERTAPPDV
jgi:hypothetical protein